jgi:CDP-6-deoxy-D-xylo-4-hexulose-3-dehydrase
MNNIFDGKTEQEARMEILSAVKAYCDTFHGGTQYMPGDRIPYASRVYDSEEMVSLADSALDFWLTAGRYADRFEKEFADFLGVRHCSLVNSGSSANLLAFMALTSPLLGEKRIGKGDEIITVAAGFPTTVAPIFQYGAVPVFADVTLPHYNVDVTALDSALTKRTKAVMLAHTLGNPFDLSSVKAFCDAHDLWLIEDNCDALGSQYCIDGVYRYTGTIGHIGTSSFYPPHHMTMGEGGAVYTNDSLLHKIVNSLRDWGRDCVCPPGIDNACGHRFDGQFGTLPLGYDHKYVYSHFGYNLKATDMQAAIGIAQLKKLPDFIEKRRTNFKRLSEGLDDLKDVLILPEAEEHSVPSWFGFPITVKVPLSRNEVTSHLEKKGIQTRLLFAGNITRHPCFDAYRDEIGESYRVIGNLENTDRIANDTFWVGVYPGMNDRMIDDMIVAVHEACRE